MGFRIAQWKRIRNSYCRRYDKLIRYVGELCYCLRKYHYILVSIFLEQHLSLNKKHCFLWILLWCWYLLMCIERRVLTRIRSEPLLVWLSSKLWGSNFSNFPLIKRMSSLCSRIGEYFYICVYLQCQYEKGLSHIKWRTREETMFPRVSLRAHGEYV